MKKIAATLSTIALLSGLALSTPLVQAATPSNGKTSASTVKNSHLVAKKPAKVKGKHKYHPGGKNSKAAAKKK